jgi:glycosyltransferase involved in cell wall biosynthesis
MEVPSRRFNEVARGTYFLTIGSPTKRKNTIILLKALKNLLDQGIHVRLVVCGSGSYLIDAELEKFIKIFHYW